MGAVGAVGAVGAGEHGRLAAAVASRFGLPAEAVEPAPAQGIANQVYFLGDALVLRIPRGVGDSVRELVKEAGVIPIVRAAGVRTPAVVEFDDSRTLADVPYLVVERVPARDLLQLGPRGESATEPYREVGRMLAGLHEVGRSSGLRVPGLEVEDGGADSAVRHVEHLAAKGYIGADQVGWLAAWFGRLRASWPDRVEPVLIHGDVAQQNILVEPAADGEDGGRRRVDLVDWGDAAWADPAIEFAKLPLRVLPDVFAGYREAMRAGGIGDPEAGWEARALRYHLHWALGGAPLEPRIEPRVWTAPPLSRLMEILRFFAGSPPPPWSSLGPDAHQYDI